MIRVYFDWNVISELKKENSEKYNLLREKINKYKTALLIHFSNYHVEDLIKNNLSLPTSRRLKRGLLKNNFFLDP